MHTPQLSFDQLFLDTGRDKRFLVAGVDEAGRGPLAGSVVAAAVILDPEQKITGLADSKVLTEERREELALQIRERSVCWCVACLLYTSPSPRDATLSRMPSSA